MWDLIRGTKCNRIGRTGFLRRDVGSAARYLDPYDPYTPGIQSAHFSICRSTGFVALDRPLGESTNSDVSRAAGDPHEKTQRGSDLAVGRSCVWFRTTWLATIPPHRFLRLGH